MKKLWIIGLIAALVGGASVSYAGCGHCEKGKKGAAAECSKKSSACDAWLKGITLSDEQKAKVDEIKGKCDGSKESCEKAKSSIREVLSAEQQKSFDENAAACSKKGACCAKDGAA